MNQRWIRMAAGVLLGAALSAVLATRVFVSFETVRVRAVRDASPAATGPRRFDIRPPADRARGPFAVIARIRNQSEVATAFTLHADGRVICAATVSGTSTRRLDCVADPWPGQIEIVPIAAVPWSLHHLEVATHHGASTGLIRALVLPGGSSSHRGVSGAWVLAGWAILTGLLLCPALGLSSRWVRYAHRLLAGFAGALFFVVLVAPHVSPYRVLLSASTFAGWSALLVVPHAAWLARSALAALPTGVRDLARRFWMACFTGGWRVAVVPAAVVVLVGVLYGQRVVGGADTYGYVSQADLWLERDLTIEQPFVTGMPWPRVPWTFAPLGYRPHSDEDASLVPIYSPGLPLMMAVAKALAGHDGLFFVVPLCAGVLVLATVGAAGRLGSGIAPVVAGWLVATSPVVLWHTVIPMSDVPVAAAWAVAFYLLLGPSAWNTVGAGCASALAIVIRPNLVLLAPVLGLHYLLQMRHPGRRRPALTHLGLYTVTAASGAIAIAALNSYLYGSPLKSGYGDLGSLFDAARVGANARNYLQWLIDAHTPIALVGLAALAIPLRRLWPEARDRTVFITIGVFVLSVWAIYCTWVVFDSWIFSRFLLPSWPFIMLGVGAAADAVYRSFAPSRLRHLVTAAVVVLVLIQTSFASRHNVFTLGRGEGRYAVIAHLTRDVTPPNSVVIALHHSGSIRYYGERMTMEFNQMDSHSLDAAASWLLERGIRTYATLESWEVPLFRERFAGARRLAALDGAPVGILEDPGRAFVFDLSQLEAPVKAPRVVTGLDLGWRAVPPSRPPTLVIGPPTPSDSPVSK